MTLSAAQRNSAGWMAADQCPACIQQNIIMMTGAVVEATSIGYVGEVITILLKSCNCNDDGNADVNKFVSILCLLYIYMKPYIHLYIFR